MNEPKKLNYGWINSVDQYVDGELKRIHESKTENFDIDVLRESVRVWSKEKFNFIPSDRGIDGVFSRMAFNFHCEVILGLDMGEK